MKILYLVPHVPQPTKVRSSQQIKGLRAAGHQVTVATLIRSVADRDAVDRLGSQGIKVIAQRLSLLQMIWNALTALISGRPLQSRLLWTHQLMDTLQTYLTTSPPDIVHVEHLRMACYGLRLVDEWPTVWDAVDHLETLYRSAATSGPSLRWRLAGGLEARLLRRYERRLVGSFPMTLAITEQDQALLQKDSDFADHVKTAPVGWELSTYDPDRRDEQTIVLTGTLNYHPNVAAARYFVRDIFPLIQRDRPETVLQLVGSNPDTSIKAMQSDSIEVTGFVPSVMDYLRKASVAVAPVQYGAGVQIKVLEAFLTATPLVATSAALRGMSVKSGEHVIVADSSADFAQAVLALLDDPVWARQIGAAGRQYLETHHDLGQTTSRLVDFYQRVIDQHMAERSRSEG